MAERIFIQYNHKPREGNSERQTEPKAFVAN
jgi:hypothetical protein